MIQLDHFREEALTVATAHEAAEEPQVAGVAQAFTEVFPGELLKVGKGAPGPIWITRDVDQHPLARGAHPPLVKHIENNNLLQVTVEHTQLFGHHPGTLQLRQPTVAAQFGYQLKFGLAEHALCPRPVSVDQQCGALQLLQQ
ncbi:hypothetical protein D3C84_730480 [compost metagenome]